MQGTSLTENPRGRPLPQKTNEERKKKREKKNKKGLQENNHYFIGKVFFFIHSHYSGIYIYVILLTYLPSQ